MGALMYKHRPTYPAMVAAVLVLLFGGFWTWCLHGRVEDGIGEPSSVVAAGCVSCGLAGILIIMAFARYQFTHLWKKPDPAFSKKARRSRRHGRL